MYFSKSGGILCAALLAVTFLWTRIDMTISHAIIVILLLFVVGSVVFEVSKALIAPYISPFRHLPGPTVRTPMLNISLNL
jgi:hypothetical protein